MWSRGARARFLGWVGVVVWCGVVFGAMPGALAETKAGNLPRNGVVSIGRMGAGVPAGWHVEAKEYVWEHDAGEGPLGIGAARVGFRGDSVLTMDSPAFAMRAGMKCMGGLWVRSEPAGRAISLALLDNNSEETYLSNETKASSEWTLLKIEGETPKAVRDRYFLKLSVGGGAGTVYLDGLWFGESPKGGAQDWKAEVLPAGVVLEPVAAWGVVTGDGVLRVKARVVGASKKGCSLRVHAVNTVGVEADLPAVALDEAGFWEGSFEVQGEVARPFGMVRVEGTVVDADGRTMSPMSETLLARVPEPMPGPMPDSYFGVHVSLREPDVTVVTNLGYKWCRIHDASGITKWGRIEPEPGKWLWHDDEVNLVRSKGLSIMGLLDSSPAWESGTDRKDDGYWSIYTAPKDIEKWRNYVRQVVGHYRGAIDEWEVWNEPWDMMRFFYRGTPQLYVDLLKAAYEETKATNPNATIVGIDTYPPMWDIATLAMGAYPYYDTMSWHRYDPNLHGRPNDAIARVTERLRAEQAKYGAPKPTLATEGGPDVTLFHGSFFSFADPEVVGDWSESADRYVRMFMGVIAAGNTRFISYSVHNDTRHGWSTHMMVEPHYLLRPMHAALAGMANFVDGAKYEGRLVPAEDISAHVFSQPHDRPWGKGPSVVVVLIADGPDAEALPGALPEGVSCFDRWGNALQAPTQATRSPVYVVVSAGDAFGLLAALPGRPAVVRAPETPKTAKDANEALAPLVDAAVAALTTGEPALWPLFSAQASLAVLGSGDGTLRTYRAELRDDAAAAAFRLPAGVHASAPAACFRAGDFAVGRQELVGDDGAKWTLGFSAAQDGYEGRWRLLTLSVLEDSEAPAEVVDEATRPLEVWEAAMKEGTVKALWREVDDKPGCFAASTPNYENFLFARGDYIITMLNTALLWGAASKSEIAYERVVVQGDVASVSGKWKLVSFAFGMGPHYPFDAVLVKGEDGWKLASFCAGP